ncbi:MAG: cytochrome c3 family protein [bacterium]
MSDSGKVREALRVLVLLLLPVLALVPTGAGAVTRSEFTRQECAICHVRWLDPMGAQEAPGQDPWKPSLIKETLDVVSSEEMCYSCHDGFVMDSRHRVWEGTGHSVGKKPSHNIRLPETMPLDREGKVYCGTCHTPHGVGEQTAELTGSVFLRTENTDSRLCTECHRAELEDPGRRNHPVNVLGREALPGDVYWLGGRLATDPKKIICQSCHTPHGKGTLIRPVLDSSLCTTCHASKAGGGASLRNGGGAHPVGIVPGRDLSAARVNRYGARWGDGQRLLCATCHGTHSGLSRSMTLDPDPSRFCQGCHPEETNRLAGGKHDLLESMPGARIGSGETAKESGICRTCHRAHGWALTGPEGVPQVSSLCLGCHREGGNASRATVGRYSHPVHLEIPSLREGSSLKPVRRNGKSEVACSTCHDPHGGHGAAGPASAPAAAGAADPMLRVPEGDLCRECHLEHFTVEGTRHDLRTGTGRKKIEAVFGRIGEGHPCVPCHSVHQGRARGLWFAELPLAENSFDAEETTRKCLTCHRLEPFGRIREKMGHPVGKPMKTEYLPAPADELRLGRITTDPEGHRDVVICSTCHLNHGRKNPDGSVTLYAGGGVAGGDLCIACHRANARIIGSPHDFRKVPDGSFRPDGGRSLKSGVCAGCHVNHEASIEKGLIAFAVNPPKGKGNPEDMFCLHCHLDPRVRTGQTARFYIHSSGDEVQRRFEEMQAQPGARLAGRLGEPTRTTSGGYEALFRIHCTTCHDNHRWTPMAAAEAPSFSNTVLTSFLRGIDVAETLCANCHGAEALYRYRFYHQERAFRIRIPNE